MLLLAPDAVELLLNSCRSWLAELLEAVKPLTLDTGSLALSLTIRTWPGRTFHGASPRDLDRHPAATT